jgi:hypothetical protein
MAAPQPPPLTLKSIFVGRLAYREPVGGMWQVGIPVAIRGYFSKMMQAGCRTGEGANNDDNGSSAMVRAVRPARRVHGEMAKRGDARDTPPVLLGSAFLEANGSEHLGVGP